MIIKHIFPVILICSIVGFLEACTGVGPATNLFRPSSPHDQYAQSLKEAKLDKTALGTDWAAVGERALRDSLTIAIPYRESGYF